MAKRDPLQVSPEFRLKILALQKSMEFKENKRISIRELTERIAKSTTAFDDIERKLMAKIKKGDIKLNFDGRKFG